MKTKVWKILLMVVVVLIAAEIFTLLFLFFRSPSTSEQIEPGASGIHVGLQLPTVSEPWPLNAYIPLSINAIGSQAIQNVSLYINGDLYESQTLDHPRESYTETWTWQPGTTGQFILVARAVGIDGATGNSQPVMVIATNAAFSVTPIEASAGDTLQSAADANGLPLEDMLAANPDADPTAPFEESDMINLPNPITPVTNTNIIQGFDLPAPEEPSSDGGSGTPSQDQAGDMLGPVELIDLAVVDSSGDGEGENNTPSGSQFENFKFWFKNNLLPLVSKEDSGEGSDSASEENPPYEPVIEVNFSGCDARIRLKNIGAFFDSSDPLVEKHDEIGFFLYRSRDGKPFERIATWPKVTSIADAYSDLYQYGYSDSAQYGVVTYYLSAFNNDAEVPGEPVSIPLAEAGCDNPNAGRQLSQVYLEDGILHLPYNMDLAYFYIQIDQGNNLRSRGWRVPEGDRSFLPESGVKLNLYTYLNTILDKVNAADLDLFLQVWGWSGSKLVHAGDFKVSIHRSVLLVCSVEGEGGCTGSGGGEWLPEITLANTKPVNEQKYEVHWLASKISPMKDLCIQLAAGPYPNDDYWQVSLPISAYCMDVKGYEGTFLLDLGAALYPPGPKNTGSWGNGTINNNYMRFDSNWFQFDNPVGTPFTLYMRAYPRHESSGFNRYANIATLHYNTAPLPSEMPPLASTYPSIYDIEILEDTYVAPVFETDEKWGCVIVDEDPTNQYSVGQEVCPPPMDSGEDDCAGENIAWCLLKGMANSFGWLYDYVVWGWDLAKWQYARWIAETIPYCAESDDCVFVVKKGIDYGIQYASGIPANPPKSEDLIADSIADYIVESAIEGEKYYTGLDVSAIEVYCEVVTDCKEEISKAIKKKLQVTRSIASQPACIAGYEAYFHGKRPTCLDPSIIVHPAPGGGNYPGSIAIQITRKNTPESLAVTQADAEKYMLDITVFAENTYNNDAISGYLYQTNRLQIPWLEPGESFIISTSLIKCENSSQPGCAGGINYYGFEALYFGATAHMKAIEACYSSGSSWEWVPCLSGGSDAFDFTNPNSKLE